MTKAMSSFIIIMTLFQTLSASMATVTSSSKLPTLVSSGRSTPKLPHYSVLKLIRPLAADRHVSTGVVGLVTDENWESLVLRAEDLYLVLVLFKAKWDPTSLHMITTIEELADDFDPTPVKFYILDIDDSPQTPSKYGIRDIPAVLFFKNGELREKHGLESKEALAIRIEQYLRYGKQTRLHLIKANYLKSQLLDGLLS